MSGSLLSFVRMRHGGVLDGINSSGVGVAGDTVHRPVTKQIKIKS